MAEGHCYNHCYSWEHLRSHLDRLPRSRHGHVRPFRRGMAGDRRYSCSRIHRDHVGRSSRGEDSFRDLGSPCPATTNNRNYLSIELKNLAILWDGKDY